MIIFNALGFTDMAIEKSVVEKMLDQTTILAYLHMPLKLSIMFTILIITIMGIWKGFVESPLHLTGGKTTNSISLREDTRDK